MKQLYFEVKYIHQWCKEKKLKKLSPALLGYVRSLMVYMISIGSKSGRPGAWHKFTIYEAIELCQQYLKANPDIMMDFGAVLQDLAKYERETGKTPLMVNYIPMESHKTGEERGEAIKVLCGGIWRSMALFLDLPGMSDEEFFLPKSKSWATHMQRMDQIFFGRPALFGANLIRRFRITQANKHKKLGSHNLYCVSTFGDMHGEKTTSADYCNMCNNEQAYIQSHVLFLEIDPPRYLTEEDFSTMTTKVFTAGMRTGTGTKALRKADPDWKPQRGGGEASGQKPLPQQQKDDESDSDSSMGKAIRRLKKEGIQGVTIDKAQDSIKKRKILNKMGLGKARRIEEEEPKSIEEPQTIDKATKRPAIEVMKEEQAQLLSPIRPKALFSDAGGAVGSAGVGAETLLVPSVQSSTPITRTQAAKITPENAVKLGNLFFGFFKGQLAHIAEWS